MTAYKGRCLCGAVTLTADGPPESVVACHCVSCRRFSGTPVTVYADYNRERIQFTGEEATECVLIHKETIYHLFLLHL